MTSEELDDSINTSLELKLDMVDVARITCGIGGVHEEDFKSALTRVLKRRRIKA